MKKEYKKAVYSLEEAKKTFYDIIQQEQEAEEYSNSAWIKLADVQFIDDPIIESNITASDSRNMPLRQATYLEYSFTEEEKKYLLHAASNTQSHHLPMVLCLQPYT